MLTRRQRVRFLGDGGAVIRELLWGEGAQPVRQRARGARRIGVRAEGSQRAVVLDSDAQPAAGDRLTAGAFNPTVSVPDHALRVDGEGEPPPTFMFTPGADGQFYRAPLADTRPARR